MVSPENHACFTKKYYIWLNSDMAVGRILMWQLARRNASTFSVHLGQPRFHPGLRSSAIADDVGEGTAVGGGSGRGGWIAHGDEGDGFERGG